VDKFDLYELCVTDGPRLAAFARAVHGGWPRVLREDFSGTGALARAWVSEAVRGETSSQSIAVDFDRGVLARAKRMATHESVQRLMRFQRQRAEACRIRADIIAATNFPVGYCHDRAELVQYLTTARRSLKRNGVFFCDTYGGSRSMTTGITTRSVRGPKGERVRQIWDQRRVDPLNGRVLDVISFEVMHNGRTKRYPDGFVYDWRLWSIPELRDAMIEAGFRSTEVYHRLGDAVDHEGRLYVRPLDGEEAETELGDDWVVYVVGRVEGPVGGPVERRTRRRVGGR
jgi:hypothetical protein